MATNTDRVVRTHKREVIDKAVLRFCGDSGAGMQITGSQFTNTVALYGNDLATFPDYPAEIRAPAGTIPGVSGFQIQFSSGDVFTPGDAVDVLVAMNPAALRTNVKDLKPNGILIINSDAFTDNDLRKADLTSNPLEDHTLDGYRLFPVGLERLTRTALQDLGLDAKSMDRCKNFFALGMCYWLYNRTMDLTYKWIEDKFKTKALLVEANKLAMRAGYNYCEATEAFQVSYEIPPAKLTPGTYRNLSGGPSPGLPTTTEQADLRQAMFGRNSEAPIPILAPSTPGDCFWVAVEACRIALKYMVPVIILSDGYLANGAEPWRIPTVDEIPGIKVKFATDPIGFHPYSRDANTLARPWAIPGTPGLEHRIGGIEKQDGTGNINYEPLNHEKMVRLRAAKVEAVAQDIPDLIPAGDPDGDLLIVAWGSTYGAITAGMKTMRAKGHRIGHIHLRHLHPLAGNLVALLGRCRHVLVPEMNLGQLLMLLRAKFLVDAQGYNTIQGQP